MGITLKTKHFDKEFDMGYGAFYRLRNKIYDATPGSAKDGTISFLTQSDCEGKLTAKECKELLSDIVDMIDDGDNYGYVHSSMTLTEFKEMLRNCVCYRCCLFWR